jgi:hypothetical protein
LALAMHDLVIEPIQPLHFTRGYVWLPLCLIALPLVQRALVAAQRRWRPAAFATASGALLLLASADNVGALGTGLSMSSGLGVALRPPERDVFRWMDARRLDGVLLCSDNRVSYLAATYTAARPYTGHPDLTPDRLRRFTEVRRWRDDADPGTWDPPPDYVLVPREDGPAPPDGATWQVLHENADLVLYGRVE